MSKYISTFYHHLPLSPSTLQILVVLSLLSLDFLPDTFEDVDILFFLLNHLHPAFSHLQDSFLKIQSFDLAVAVILDKFEDSNESSRPSDPRTAVDQDGIFDGGVELHGFVDEVSEYLGVVRGREVGPLDGLQLGHLYRRLVRSLNTDHSEEEEYY